MKKKIVNISKFKYSFLFSVMYAVLLLKKNHDFWFNNIAFLKEIFKYCKNLYDQHNIGILKVLFIPQNFML